MAEDRRWVLAFAAFAALRVLCSAAVFPFFDNVDEQAHFDLVVKYASGDLPRALEPYASESATAISLYGSPEYLWPPERFGGRFPAPLALHAGPLAQRTLAESVAEWTRDTNTESAEPPLYYALAALWLHLGELLGLGGVTLLFWLRALNALSAAALVALGHAAARAVFPESRVQRLGVPLLLAVFPQDAFYSIGADVLSPLFVGLGFLGALQLVPERAPSCARAAVTGLALAAAVLAKTANLPLVAMLGAALALRAAGSRARALRPALAVALACAALPIAAWLAWNHSRFGDWTGTAAKVTRLDWTAKPLGEWLPHPLFTGAGLYAFWSELAASFWRGEFVWHGQRLAHRGMDVFYWGSSALLPLAALLRPPPAHETRRALSLSALCFAAGILFLAALSLAFDFGRCFYPSRAHPFFTSGRLLGGALIPFLVLYVHGLDRALAWSHGARARWLALGAIALAVTVSEAWLGLGPLASAYNVLHLR